MYCKNCGSNLDDNAQFCPNCGTRTGEEPRTPVKDEANTLAIVGFIFSFFIAIVGLICSIMGYKKAPEFGGKGKGLALAGIIISAISMGIYFIAVIAATMVS